MNTGRRYVLISPCRDEAGYMRQTLDSVAAQTVPPSLWVVVDDGSSDATPAILREYAQRLPYLRVVRRDDRGGRSVGPGVMQAFHAGLETVDLGQFDYVCKLDLDLVLPPRYFELLMARMEANPRLGTTSGKPYFHDAAGALVAETIGDEMSVGASKFYRTACFREIGGFVRQVMWDGIDCHRCRMLGWMAESVDDGPLRFLHLRPMGSSQKGGIWAGRMRTGFGQYFMGTSPVFVLASAAYRLPRHPVIRGSAAILWGYVTSVARRLPRYDDPDFRRFLRGYQRSCLLHGKREATRRVDEARGAVWRAAHSGEARPANANADAELARRSA
jgi:biofilm PGA synthesis N-glycosyltransferase PgaC